MAKVYAIIGIIILTSAWHTLTCYGCDVRLWGVMCDKACPTDCATCTHDSVDGGRPCTSCGTGKYSSPYPYNDNCRNDCRGRCVSCTSADQCNKCVDGFYGTACQYSCYSGCEGGQCDTMDGTCTCRTGYASRFCRGQLYCTNNPCACCQNNTCETNKDNYCTYGCIHGVRGDKCDNECPANCVTCTQGNGVSDRPCTACEPSKYSGRAYDSSFYSYYDDCRHDCSGLCVSCTSWKNCTQCVEGRHGPDCSFVCSTGCEGGICSKTVGSCACVNGRYGTRCDKYCGNGCQDRSCDQTNGSCSCKSEFTGVNCDRCASNTSGLYPNCVVYPDVSNDEVSKDVEIVGGSIGGVVGVMIMVMLILFVKRRYNRPQCCSISTNDVTQGPEQIKLVAVNAVNAVDNETSEVSVDGKISYYADKVLGYGAHGIVYKGRYGRFEKKTVAVKIIKCSNDQDAKDTQTELQNIYKEIKAMEILAENTHIIQLFDTYISNNSVYLVFNLAMGTLVDYTTNAPWRISLTSENVVRGIVDGLNYIHKKNIVHRDLKPGNIFIIDHGVSGLIAVIGDFGQAKATTGNMFTFTGNFGSNAYIAPEIWIAMSDTAATSVGTQFNKASDVFALGLVVYYAISLGKHPFGNEMTAQVSISRGNLPTFHDIAKLINLFAYEDILKRMLKNNPDDRPSVQVVSEHPALWTSDTIIKYFVLKSDEFESRIRAGTTNINLLEDPYLIPNGDWMNRLPVNMGTYLRSYKLPNRASPLYKGKEKEVRFLLRAIRNTNGHYHVYPQNTQADLGNYPEGHLALWLTVCPNLLMHVYNKL